MSGVRKAQTASGAQSCRLQRAFREAPLGKEGSLTGWNLLDQFPVVGIVGARQVGKSTLSRLVVDGAGSSAHSFDLEDPRARARLDAPMLGLEPLRGLVVLDEVQRLPGVFEVLRVLAQTMRRFWTMLAHAHGQTLNASAIGRSFGVVDGERLSYRALDIEQNELLGNPVVVCRDGIRVDLAGGHSCGRGPDNGGYSIICDRDSAALLEEESPGAARERRIGCACSSHLPEPRHRSFLPCRDS